MLWHSEPGFIEKNKIPLEDFTQNPGNLTLKGKTRNGLVLFSLDTTGDDQQAPIPSEIFSTQGVILKGVVKYKQTSHGFETLITPVPSSIGSAYADNLSESAKIDASQILNLEKQFKSLFVTESKQLVIETKQILDLDTRLGTFFEENENSQIELLRKEILDLKIENDDLLKKYDELSLNLDRISEVIVNQNSLKPVYFDLLPNSVIGRYDYSSLFIQNSNTQANPRLVDPSNFIPGEMYIPGDMYTEGEGYEPPEDYYVITSDNPSVLSVNYGRLNTLPDDALYITIQSYGIDGTATLKLIKFSDYLYGRSDIIVDSVIVNVVSDVNGTHNIATGSWDFANSNYRAFGEAWGDAGGITPQSQYFASGNATNGGASTLEDYDYEANGHNHNFNVVPIILRTKEFSMESGGVVQSFYKDPNYEQKISAISRAQVDGATEALHLIPQLTVNGFFNQSSYGKSSVNFLTEPQIVTIDETFEQLFEKRDYGYPSKEVELGINDSESPSSLVVKNEPTPNPTLMLNFGEELKIISTLNNLKFTLTPPPFNLISTDEQEEAHSNFIQTEQIANVTQTSSVNEGDLENDPSDDTIIYEYKLPRYIPPGTYHYLSRYDSNANVYHGDISITTGELTYTTNDDVWTKKLRTSIYKETAQSMGYQGELDNEIGVVNFIKRKVHQFIVFTPKIEDPVRGVDARIWPHSRKNAIFISGQPSGQRLSNLLAHEFGHGLLNIGDSYWAKKYNHSEGVRDLNISKHDTMATGKYSDHLLISKTKLGWIPSENLHVFNPAVELSMGIQPGETIELKKSIKIVDLLHPSADLLVNQTPGLFSGVEFRLAEGHNLMIEYRDKSDSNRLQTPNYSINAGADFDRFVMISDSLTNIDASRPAYNEARLLLKRPPVLFSLKDDDTGNNLIDGPIINADDPSHEYIIKNIPGFLDEGLFESLSVRVLNVETESATVELSFSKSILLNGTTPGPDPSIRDWGSGYQSPDIEVRNSFNDDASEASKKNLPYLNGQNEVVVTVRNSTNFDADNVSINLYVRDYGVTREDPEEFFIANQTANISAGSEKEVVFSDDELGTLFTGELSDSNWHKCLVAIIEPYNGSITDAGGNDISVTERNYFNNRAQSNYSAVFANAASPADIIYTPLRIVNTHEENLLFYITARASNSGFNIFNTTHSAFLKPGESKEIFSAVQWRGDISPNSKLPLTEATVKFDCFVTPANGEPLVLEENDEEDNAYWFYEGGAELKIFGGYKVDINLTSLNKSGISGVIKNGSSDLSLGTPEGHLSLVGIYQNEESQEFQVEVFADGTFNANANTVALKYLDFLFIPGENSYYSNSVIRKEINE
ncbi:hypothetical protein N8766_05220 [bacterium]|nr:hypothetical protein [bacterium]